MINFIELHYNYNGAPACIRVSAIQTITADECGRAVLDIEDCQTLITVEETYKDVKDMLLHEPHKMAVCVSKPRKKEEIVCCPMCGKMYAVSSKHECKRGIDDEV
jgi:hypothetical protein